MKNYLPEYRRKKGQPRNVSNLQKVLKNFTKEDKNKIQEFVTEVSITTTSKETLKYAESIAISFLDVTEKPLKEINKLDIQNYVTLVNNSNKTRSARHKLFYFLKRFLSLNIKNEKLLKIIKNKRETGNGSYIKKSDLITPEELESMLRLANNLKNKALLMLLYESGARPDEILNLKWKDVIINDDNKAEISLFSGKKKETRTIIVEDCVIHLKRWKAEYSYPDISLNDYVFVGNIREKALTTQYLRKMIQRLGKKAGIERRIFPYLFRHTRLTFMRQKLKTPHYIQFAGHTERQATSYTHLDIEDLKEALLKEIYQTKEIPKDKKEEYEQRLKELQENNNKLTNIMKKIIISFQKMNNYYLLQEKEHVKISKLYHEKQPYKQVYLENNELSKALVDSVFKSKKRIEIIDNNDKFLKKVLNTI